MQRNLDARRSNCNVSRAVRSRELVALYSRHRVVLFSNRKTFEYRKAVSRIHVRRMPKGRAKPKPNAFMIWIKDRKKEMESEGHTFASMEEAVNKIGPEWEHIPKDERLPYEERAKKLKEKLREEAMGRVARSWDEAKSSAGMEDPSKTVTGIPG